MLEKAFAKFMRGSSYKVRFAAMRAVRGALCTQAGLQALIKGLVHVGLVSLTGGASECIFLDRAGAMWEQIQRYLVRVGTAPHRVATWGRRGSYLDCQLGVRVSPRVTVLIAHVATRRPGFCWARAAKMSSLQTTRAAFAVSWRAAVSCR